MVAVSLLRHNRTCVLLFTRARDGKCGTSASRVAKSVERQTLQHRIAIAVLDVGDCVGEWRTLRVRRRSNAIGGGSILTGRVSWDVPMPKTAVPESSRPRAHSRPSNGFDSASGTRTHVAIAESGPLLLRTTGSRCPAVGRIQSRTSSPRAVRATRGRERRRRRNSVRHCVCSARLRPRG
jgi:hypothetical protein